jgi:hypothetical protein
MTGLKCGIKKSNSPFGSARLPEIASNEPGAAPGLGQDGRRRQDGRPGQDGSPGQDTGRPGNS